MSGRSVFLLLLLAGPFQASPSRGEWICNGAFDHRDLGRLAEDLLTNPSQALLQSLPSRRISSSQFANSVSAGQIATEAGRQSDGTYFFREKGAARMVKIFREIAPRDFSAEISNARVMAKSGGPRIHGAGRVSVEGIGDRYYIELEWLYPDHPVLTLKAAYYEDPAIIREWLDKGVIDQMAKLVIRAFENGGMPRDVDFIVNRENFETSWIDSGWWRRFTDVHQLKQNDFSDLEHVSWRLEEIESGVGARFKSSMIEQVQMSEKLGSEDKAILSTKLRAISIDPP